jgi:DNA-binding NarL/FixJ family response regulator
MVTMPITVVIADDHPLILDSLERLFALEPDIKVVAQCLDGNAVLPALRAHHPDVLLLDLSMPAMGGLEVLRRMRDEGLATRVVLLTGALDEDQMIEAIGLGVRGVMLKELGPRLIVDCVRKVHAGEQWLEKHAAGRALQKMLQREAGTRELANLVTQRELEIIRMVASGLRNKEIGDKLFISEGTVKIHLHNIYQKLDVKGRMELSVLARDKRLL